MEEAGFSIVDRGVFGDPGAIGGDVMLGCGVEAFGEIAVGGESTVCILS